MGRQTTESMCSVTGYSAFLGGVGSPGLIRILEQRNISIVMVATGEDCANI